MKRFLPYIFSKIFFQKIVSIAILVAICYIFREFFSLFLITFVFAYLTLEIAQFIRKKILYYSKRHPNNFWKFFEKYGRINNLVTILYILFVLLIIWIFASIVPKISMEIEGFIRRMPHVLNQVQELLFKLEENLGVKLGVPEIMNEVSSSFDFQETGREVIRYLQNAGGILVQFFIGIVMSYIFVIDRQDVFSFFGKMNRGNFSFVYQEFRYFSSKIVAGF